MGGGAQAPIVLSSVVGSYITAMLIMAILFLDNMVVPVVNAKEACNELTPNFYAESCPQLEHIVHTVVKAAVLKETRMAASLMRLEFHDCFVNGCDGSLLLDDTANFTGEKTAKANIGSLRGYEVIDEIKAQLEIECPHTVSCADILALVARDSIVEVGGPSWTVEYGRRDSTTANLTLANLDLPSALISGPQLIRNFASKGFNLQQLVALSGGHTIGFARCAPIAPSLYGPFTDDHSMNIAYHTFLEKACPNGSAPSLIPLDDGTPGKFDSSYYTKLLEGNGALHSDRIMIDESGRTVLEYVSLFAKDQECFFKDFAKAMVLMGRLQPLTGSEGQIRTNCHFVNPPSKLKTIPKTLNHKLPLRTPAADLHP